MDATSRSLSSSQLDEHAIYRPRDARCSFAELMNVQRSNHSQENEGIGGDWRNSWPLEFDGSTNVAVTVLETNLERVSR